MAERAGLTRALRAASGVDPNAGEGRRCTRALHAASGVDPNAGAGLTRALRGASRPSALRQRRQCRSAAPAHSAFLPNVLAVSPAPLALRPARAANFDARF